MIATEPLPDSTWKEIGLADREAFGDARRMVTYGQRTADGRIAFGARGTYEFGSGIRRHFDPDHPHFHGMKRLLRGFFPVLEDVRFTHHWGGAMAVPRNWRPVVGLEQSTKRAWLGGYVGQGVAASNLAGRTLAELIAGEETERTRLPWVAKPGRDWEPEPLRWLAVSSIARAGQLADEAEDAGRTSRFASRLFDAMTD
jgi:glycine/D-amino acid oxidase-like deaminating enzyme